MRLFIDDVRYPKHVFEKESALTPEPWMVARNYDEAIAYIEQYKPQRIAFDHDLGYMQKTGMDVAKYLVQRDMAAPDAGYITEHFLFTSHSANPEGKRNIMLLLHNYMCEKYFN